MTQARRPALAFVTLALSCAVLVSGSLSAQAVSPQPVIAYVPPPCPVWHGLTAFVLDIKGLHPRVDELMDCVYQPPISSQSLYPQPLGVEPWGCRYACFNWLSVYTVKPGDTLWGLLVRWGEDPTQWPFLAQINSVTDVYNLQVGRQLFDLP